MYRISPQKHHKCYTNASQKCRGDKVEQGKKVEKNIFAFGAPPAAAAGVVGSHFWEENLRIFSSPRGECKLVQDVLLFFFSSSFIYPGGCKIKLCGNFDLGLFIGFAVTVWEFFAGKFGSQFSCVSGKASGKKVRHLTYRRWVRVSRAGVGLRDGSSRRRLQRQGGSKGLSRNRRMPSVRFGAFFLGNEKESRSQEWDAILISSIEEGCDCWRWGKQVD